MKTIPMLFSTKMVQAILDGRKTQTRRIITPQPNKISPMKDFNDSPMLDVKEIWVRETWRTTVDYDYVKPSELPYEDVIPIHYKADKIKWGVPWGIWRPSIFMPRWASRITLNVKDVRAERLMHISPKDAIAEGIDYERHYSGSGNPCDEIRILNAFQELWDSINEKRGYGWYTNPWVWVFEFEVQK